MEAAAPLLDLIFTEKAIPFWSALLGASFALIGQIVSGAISIAKDNGIEKRRISQAQTMAAVQLEVAMLELVRICHVLVFKDRLYVSPDDPTDARFGVATPSASSLETPYLERLEPELARSVLLLKQKLSVFEFTQSLTDMTVSPYGGIEDVRRKSFAAIGLEAIEIINRTSKKHKLASSVSKEIAECQSKFLAMKDSDFC